MPYRVMMVFGTRPEAIKMAPLARELRQRPEIELYVCVTGQHREMLQQVLDAFELQVDENLQVMTEGQTLNGLSQQLLGRLDQVYEAQQPEIVLVHGDTTTSFVAALAAFHRHIPVAHVEAGLRTGDVNSPWPEEANRHLTAVIASLHFPPTRRARDNLLREWVPLEQMEVTGNTVIDALQWMRAHLDEVNWQPAAGSPLAALPKAGRLVLITGHRRENFGKGFERICQAIAALADKYPDVLFVYPVHLNPQVQQPVHALLGGRANIRLIPPQDYPSFVWLMGRSHLILTDSGGIQEEAPSLGKPVLVMRRDTERPSAVAAGTVRLVGTNPQRIVTETSLLLDDVNEYQQMSQASNPYGDGHASEHIADRLILWLHEQHEDAAV
ncbi:UDP-N-acetylglucosamine 2-epimerase (non-hydrolyzing) [Pseudomonas cavernae]|uniref:UDP-N-acetylglucosamine 2-epimerase (non-hydrolyzing) n=1 Tax=Pseudomonas cavernae TaxID=2320867 RepID=A0A385YZW6_9PSED|nr:UDP-N-acetylglucosamine 2-epimerase (non-hydrolyzing) [Pseudomonas cavernae]AYC32034.1 UDP-N-acetylglucosamine 2-epimerase (non-hydrolyzing) [Pseudomonas cavernae]